MNNSLDRPRTTRRRRRRRSRNELVALADRGQLRKRKGRTPAHLGVTGGRGRAV